MTVKFKQVSKAAGYEVLYSTNKKFSGGNGKNIYQLISDVNENNVPVTITNNKGKNAVRIGEADWRAINYCKR